MKNEEIAVNIQDFNFWYSDFQALHGINLSITAHEITSLIGPSGCGKSTLLKCINRINERSGTVKTQGSIDVFGHDIYHPNTSTSLLRKNVGMVFQKPNPLPLSIYENVTFGLKAHRELKNLNKNDLNQMVEEALTKVGMWDEIKNKLHKSATGLSLEKQQKLCIARLLPLKPKLILLDEPCSALDPKGTAAVEELIRELRNQYTIIIVTHSMGQAKRVSDKTVFMYMGELIETGDTSTLFNNPTHQQTANYIEGRFG